MRWDDPATRPRPLPSGLRMVQLLLVLLLVVLVLVILTAWITSDEPTRWIVEQ